MRRTPVVVEREPAWGRSDSLLKYHQPLFWLVCALMVGGASYMQATLGPSVSVNTAASSLMMIGWLLYLLPFVGLINFLDLHEPEPPAMLAAAFAWGALVAVPVADVANASLISIMYKQLANDVVARWSDGVVGPVTEEPLKALGLLVLVILARRQFTTILDGIVYGAFVGLGFQVAENLVLTAQELRIPRSGGNEAYVLAVLELRGLGLGLWSHAVWTALVGAGIAYALTRPSGSRLRGALAVASCLLGAMGLHLLWNAPWWQADTTSLATAFPTYAAKGSPALVLVAVIAVAARSREVQWFSIWLRDQRDVSPVEVEALATLRGRRAARRAALLLGGRPGLRAARALQAAQVALAVALAVRPDDVDACRRRVSCAGAALDAALISRGWRARRDSNPKPSDP